MRKGMTKQILNEAGLSQNDEYVGKLISPETITANGGHVFRWIKTNWGIS